MTRLEHINMTVRDPDGVAAALCDVLGWRVRWSGAALGDGRSVHVGDDASYVALYRPPGAITDPASTYGTHGAMNHLGVVVDDLDAAERAVVAKGYAPRSHADYEPGRRFYFDGPEGIEVEVVSYT
ncbi:VOC family protein [Jannaschia sp. S6380]|uniref:VOC family protein n=1 Tax=Jannaschia sp. S6380 TaxID=2926408 RepID=UPI001FF6F584|nr:VOC family protein [Jannaschia sp. S6380]MCK0167906.1 VOC family protein [Jannaschia sp. S6380]